MEEKLVKVLLDQYKEKGVDLYALLDDSFFMKLDLETKVKLIKEHAAEISAGTARGMTKNDIRNIVFDAAMAGVGTGVGATMAAKSVHQFFAKGTAKMPIGLIAGAAALGATMTAANAYVNSQRTLKKKDDILKKIKETADNPTDENALGVLVTRNHQFNRPTTSTFKGNAKDNLADTLMYDVPSMVLSHVPHHIAAETIHENYTRPGAIEYAPGHDADTVGDAYSQVFGQRESNIESLKQRLMMTAFGTRN